MNNFESTIDQVHWVKSMKTLRQNYAGNWEESSFQLVNIFTDKNEAITQAEVCNDDAGFDGSLIGIRETEQGKEYAVYFCNVQ